MRFHYQSLPMRVTFGAGLLSTLAEELGQLGLSRVLVLSTPEQQELAERVSAELGELSVGVHAGARMHVPIESARRARDAALASHADGCVAIGGGSTTGLGKAIALESDLRIVSVPTTYAGSEMTSVWGLTVDGEKKTGRDPRVLPVSVLYDPELTTGLPVGLSVTSGFNAIAHAVEALYAPDRSPIISLVAEDGIRALVHALPGIVADGHDIAARTGALYGAWLCGAALGATTMSLHHKLCHVLGGSFNLAHADTHTIVLPYVLAYNSECAPQMLAALRRATGSDEPAAFLWSLSRTLGAPTSLRDIGLAQADIARAADLATTSAYANPRDVTPAAVREIITAAWLGEPLQPDGLLV